MNSQHLTPCHYLHTGQRTCQPCGDFSCADCAPFSTAEARLAELLEMTRELAESSEYYHAPTDSNVGRA